jgi:hypothetical protein
MRHAARQTHSREAAHKNPGEEGGGVGSLGAGAALIRSYCLNRSEVRAADLQRVYRLTFSEACRALEELEALRLLGSAPGPGARRWGVGLPVDDSRVRLLRRVLGWASSPISPQYVK